MEKFPTRYLQLTTRLLSQMKETMPVAVVSGLFKQVAEDLASEYAEQVRGLGMEERLDFVQSLLAEEGFTVEWEKKGEDYEIHEDFLPLLSDRRQSPRGLRSGSGIDFEECWLCRRRRCNAF